MSDDPFSVSVAKYIKRAKENGEAALQAIAQDALARVKELTPVKTGTLRANWVVTASTDLSAIEGARYQDSVTLVATLRLGDTVVISNPVKYAARLEFGFVGKDSLGRYYNQHGVGMMQQTIAEMPKIAAAAVRRVNA